LFIKKSGKLIVVLITIIKMKMSGIGDFENLTQYI